MINMRCRLSNTFCIHYTDNFTLFQLPFVKYVLHCMHFTSSRVNWLKHFSSCLLLTSVFEWLLILMLYLQVTLNPTSSFLLLNRAHLTMVACITKVESSIVLSAINEVSCKNQIIINQM